jgi:hypothetical protein
MPINIEIKVVPFGQLRLEVGKVAPSAEKPQTFPAKDAIRYHEPQETLSRRYEVQYREKPANCIVPLSTG